MQKRMSDLTPKDAATVILVRDQISRLEVFLMRRNKKQNFMGGYFVFPGGQLDDADCDSILWDKCCSSMVVKSSQRLQEPGLPESIARGLHMAAIRETFEESGILLATSASGKSTFGFNDAKTLERFTLYRRRIYRGEITMMDLAVLEGIRFKPNMMIPYAHWITPEIQRTRYNTRFFLARLPNGQHTSHDEDELIASGWVTPEDALRMNEIGEMPLSPPTLKTVEELSSFRTTEQLFKTAAEREIFAILPQAYKTDEGFLGVKLPYDLDYTITDYKRPPISGESSRIVNRNGIWITAK